MNTFERVLQFLAKRQDQPYCGECIALERRAKRPLTGMLNRLNPDYIERGTIVCCRGGNQRVGVLQVQDPRTGSLAQIH